MNELLVKERLARLQRWTAGVPQPPVALEIGLTMRCDILCQFCWRHNPDRPVLKGELSIERWLDLIDEAADYGVREVRVIGEGEPLLRQGADRVLTRIKQRGLYGFLTTAGHRLRPELAELLVDIGWDSISISTHGTRPEIHDAITLVEGSHEKLQKGVRTLRDIRDAKQKHLPWIAMGTCVNTLNVTDMIRFADDTGAQSVWFEPVTVNSDLSRNLKLDGPALDEFLFAMRAAATDAQHRNIWTNAASLSRATMLATNHMDDVLMRVTPGLGIVSSPCLNPFWLLGIRANGQVSACGYFLEDHYDNAGDLGIVGAWQGAWMREIRDRMQSHKLMNMCKSCCSWAVMDTVRIRTDLEATLPKPLHHTQTAASDDYPDTAEPLRATG